MAISYFAGLWNYAYYISGTIGLVSIVLSIGYFLDSLILGNKGSFTSEKEKRKVGRLEDSQRFISIAIPNLIAAFIFVII